MPECLLLSYHANVERLRAERVLDGVQATSFPHLGKDGRSSWVRENRQRRAGALPAGAAAAAAPTAGGRVDAPFTVDGHPVGKDGLTRWLGVTFGGSPFGHPGTAPASNGHIPSQGAVR